MGRLFTGVFNIGESAKEAICVGVIMLLSMFSGMMWVQAKYYIDTFVPVLKYINPVSLITDSLYSLYYYDTYSRLFTNWAILLGISSLFIIITIAVLRRRKYASI